MMRHVILDIHCISIPPCMFFSLVPLCLDFYVLYLHVYLIHEYRQIPYDKPHGPDDDRNFILQAILVNID